MSEYNPNAKYAWEPETQFLLSGNEFGLILNTFRSVLSTPEAQKILLLNNANDVIENVLKRNVNSGNVKPEIPQQEEAPAPLKTVAKKERPKKAAEDKK